MAKKENLNSSVTCVPILDYSILLDFFQKHYGKKNILYTLHKRTGYSESGIRRWIKNGLPFAGDALYKVIVAEKLNIEEVRAMFFNFLAPQNSEKEIIERYMFEIQQKCTELCSDLGISK